MQPGAITRLSITLSSLKACDMAASFASASSQFLINSAPAFTDVPFTVGMWVRPSTIGAVRACFSMGDNNVSLSNYCFLGQTAADNWRIAAVVAGATGQTNTGIVVANKYVFLIGRFISAVNRRIAVLNPDGSAVHGQNVTSKILTGIDNMTIGATVTSTVDNLFDGSISEFWYTNTDIQPDGAQLNDALLRQLAYGGPFSVSSIVKDIIEYRSMRIYPGDGDVYQRRSFTWNNTNGVTTDSHPPLPYWYMKPGQVQSLLVV